jgi:hypothetical protein
MPKRKCILIGNSSTNLDHEVGHLIDEYDFVVRFNSYVTTGFEKHVGTKQTVWAPNLGLVKHAPTCRKYLEMPNKYIWYVGNSYVTEEKLVRLKRTMKKQFTVESINFDVTTLANSLNYPEMEFIDGKVRFGKDRKYGTTGIRGVFKALNWFGEITIHGFTFYDEIDNGNHSHGHYYEEKHVPPHMHQAFNRHPIAEHDPQAEKVVIGKLIRDGYIKELVPYLTKGE